MTTSEQQAVPVAQEDRVASADLLDEIASLIDHNGLGQVADLIRDGEYDEHEAPIAFARHRLASLPCKSGEGAKLGHEYGPSRVGHGEAQCVHCLATNRENAVIAPNVCSARVKPALTPDATQTREAELVAALDQIAFLSTNHGGWFETDPAKAYCELGDIARAALNARGGA